MEINPENRIIMNLREKMKVDNTDKTIKDIIWMLYETSLIGSGFSLEEPAIFTNRIHKLIALGLSLEDEVEAEKIDIDFTETTDTTMEEVD